MGVYDRQIATAKRIIAQKGQTATWYSVAPGSGGTAAAPAAAVETPHTVTIAFLPIDREYLRTIQAVMKDTDVPSGYLQGLMGQVDFKPTLADRVVRRVNGVDETYRILQDNGIEEIDPNGEGVILYTVRFSR